MARALATALAPEVTAYRDDDTGFALADDVAGLDAVRDAGLHEASVFYCSRIVEAMARREIQVVTGHPCSQLAALLRYLVAYRQLSPGLKHWLDRLRVLGNDARHALRPLAAADADIAFVVFLRWLHWTFCETARDPRLPNLMAPNEAPDALLHGELARLMDDAGKTGKAVLAQLTGSDPNNCPALLTPLVPAAAAEAMLANDQRWDEAHTVLGIALKRFPDDVRLRQLLGLYWSCQGGHRKSVEYLHHALRELEPLPRNGAADEETCGILGGVYKRLADLDPASAPDWLRKAHKTYDSGWEQSGRTNDYLGINAATTALFRGRSPEPIARTLREKLAKLQEQLRACGGEQPLAFWDQVTWAEAELLLGNYECSGELYRDAFSRFVERTRDVAVSIGQARCILHRLGQSGQIEMVLGAWADAGA